MTAIDFFDSSVRLDSPTAASPQLLTLPDRFDVHHVPLFADIVDNMLEARPSFLLVYGQQVTHIDEAGIYALLAADDRAAAAGTTFRVVASMTLRVALELVLELPDASVLFGNEILGQAA